MDSIIHDPRPGSANTVSTTTDPPMVYESRTPISVTIGRRAARRTWRRSTVRRSRPFARAKST
jgi:hypothetical protein